MRYVDVQAIPEAEIAADRRRQFERHGWRYPISLVDGHVVAVGSIGFYSLIRAVEQARR